MRTVPENLRAHQSGIASSAGGRSLRRRTPICISEPPRAMPDELRDTLLGWDLHRFEGDVAALRARRWTGHRLSSRCDGAARRAEPAPAAHATLAPYDLVRPPTTSFSFRLKPYQPSRLSRCGEARHHRPDELASRTQRRRLEAGSPCDAGEAWQARLAALRRLPAQHHDRAPRARSAASARHVDAAAHDLKGDALHPLRGAQGMLLAGAPQYARQ
jgi:hypothetical protein